jgi:hypothetical protein
MTTVRQRVTVLEQAMADLAAAQARTQEHLDVLSASTRQFEKFTERNLEEIRASTRRFKEFTERNLEEIRASTRRFEEFSNRTIDEMRAERRLADERSEREMRTARRQWGELANRMGTLVEDIVAPSVPAVFRRRFGIRRLDLSAQRVRRTHRSDPGRMREFDYIAGGGDLLLVNETKSTIRPDDIPAFVAVLEDARNYLPEAEGRRIAGSLAGFSVDPSVVAAAERQGVLIFGLGTGLLRVLNARAFEPRYL